MTRVFLVKLVVCVVVVCGLRKACAQEQPDLPVEPFSFAEDFESGTDPVRFWLSYGKKYTVNFKGVTDEKACSGKRSFKLDVTFNEPSRFLWHILMAKQVPVAGKLAFSGKMLLGEESTAKATLGVSFCFPPTRHNSCTAPYDFHTTTDGKWQSIGGDFVERSQQVAGSVMGQFASGVGRENVGVFLERIMFDFRGEAGQRVVLYVDDLEIRGQVPSEAGYREDMARRWAPVEAAVKGDVAAWEGQLGKIERGVAALTGLSGPAQAVRREVLPIMAGVRQTLEKISGRGHLSRAERSEVVGALAKLTFAVPNIKAISRGMADGKRAVVYTVPAVSSVRVLPSDRFLCGEISGRVSLTAARGEYEPASFVVVATSDLTALLAIAGELRGPGGDTIPASAVDIKAIKCWYQAGTAWVSIRQDKSKRILTPELLLNDDALIKVDHEKQDNHLKLSFPDGAKYVWISDPADIRKGKSLPVEKFPIKDSATLLPLDIPAGTNKQFWVTVRIPEDARAGTYAGTIRLKTQDAVIAELALSVNVLPFELLPPYYTSSMDYHGRLMPDSKGTIGSWGKSREQFTNELANMVAHGLHNCQHYSIRKEILGDVLRIREAVGMDNRTLYLKNTIRIGNPTAPEELERIKRDVRDIIEFTKAFGTETVYFYGMDERRGDVLASQRAAWTAVREAGGKIFVAGYTENVDLMGDVQDMHVRAGWPAHEEVAKWHALGHKIFSYANPQTGVENPVVYRRNFGLLLWKYDYDGASTNAYQHTFGATWNDFDHVTYRAHTIAYPTMNGVVDTIAWEGYREGVDDVRYITTLQKAVEQAARSDDRKLSRAVASAQAYLRQLKAGTDIETGDLATIRQAIITHILELTSSPEGQR